MAKYMTQPMSASIHSKVTYYRKCSGHPSHADSSQFTTDAKNSYAAKYGIAAATVEEGKYQSNQGVPYGGQTEEI